MSIETKHFEVNTEMAIKAAVAVLATFTRVCFCQIYVFVQKRMFYTRTGRTVCVQVVSSELGSVSVTRHACACVLFCVFLWVKSQDSTTPEPE